MKLQCSFAVEHTWL